jgi:hypothetical protein
MKTRTDRRRFAFCLLGSGLCLLTGCNLFGPRRQPPDDMPAPTPTGDPTKPSADQLTRYLGNQAALLQSIECRDLTIDVRAQGNSISLDGTLLCQKPRYFKLVGKKLGLQQVLVGSNEERFWFYVKQDPSDALYHCSYTDFEKGAELPFPFHPEWVLEALGMSAPAPSESMRVDEDKTTYRLIEDATVRGQKVRKVTVFYKGMAREGQPQVKARGMYDATSNKLICAATVKRVTRVPASRGGEIATCPEVITLEWPAQDTELTIYLDHVKVNSQLSMQDFQMPRLGSKTVDLGRDRPTGRSGVMPARYR